MAGGLKGGLVKQKLQDPYMAADRSRQNELSQILFGRMGIDETHTGDMAKAKKASTFDGSYTPGSLDLGAGWADGGAGGAGGAGGGGSTDVGGRILDAYGSRVSDLFNTGADQLEKTARGEYLDPTQSDAWGRLSSAVSDTGAMQYRDLLDKTRSDAARSGAFSSSARLEGEDRGARDVATNISDILGKAGFAQYGAERGLQEKAAEAGPELVGKMADVVNTMKETKLKADQLRLQGKTVEANIEEAKIRDMLELLSNSRGTPYQQATTAGNVRTLVGDINNGVSSWVGVGGGASGSNGGFMGGK